MDDGEAQRDKCLPQSMRTARREGLALAPLTQGWQIGLKLSTNSDELIRTTWSTMLRFWHWTWPWKAAVTNWRCLPGEQERRVAACQVFASPAPDDADSWEMNRTIQQFWGDSANGSCKKMSLDTDQTVPTDKTDTSKTVRWPKDARVPLTLPPHVITSKSEAPFSRCQESCFSLLITKGNPTPPHCTSSEFSGNATLHVLSASRKNDRKNRGWNWELLFFISKKEIILQPQSC